MTSITFQRIDGRQWGLAFRSSGPGPAQVPAAGTTVTVTKRDGSSTQVIVGGEYDSWNGRRVVITNIVQLPRERRPVREGAHVDRRPVGDPLAEARATAMNDFWQAQAAMIRGDMIPVLEAAQALVDEAATMDDELVSPKTVAALRAALEAAS